jgi:hypothetical protein
MVGLALAGETLGEAVEDGGNLLVRGGVHFRQG